MPGAVKSRRGYDSPRRREQAAETRRKILDAAGELFARDGYAAVAMPAIADRAGVALKTVYLAFGTKAGVLHGLWDVRLGGDDQPIPVTERPWYRELLEGDDPVALVRAAARQSRLTKERAGDLMRIIRQAAVTEPILADLWERIETEFRAVLGGFAERLAALGALAPGVDVGFSTDVLWTLNHPDTWYLLVQGCGWSADAYEQWVGDTLVTQLLGLSTAPAGRRCGLASNSKGDARHGRHRVPGLPARRPRPRVGRSRGREAGPPVGRGRG
jgi:AcrR family transcriptional regulator